jgi:tRNA-specific 2-thiouridylase
MAKSKTKKNKVRAIVLFSGGLDSRLAIKLLQEQGIEVIALMFKLPFGGGCCNDEMCSLKFSQLQGTKLEIIDCTKGKLFNEYIKMLKKPVHGRGAGINPCIDCRIFIFKHAKSFLKKFKADFIATGEVLGERPMSQYRKAMEIIEEKSGLKDKLLRPLSAKLLPETPMEKTDLVKRNKLLSIQGRSRKPQIALAKKFKIDFPHPAGGCILCEKNYAPKLHDLFKHEKTIIPIKIQSLQSFRHFRIKDKIILGRNHKENLLLEKLNKKLKYQILIPKIPGPTILYKSKQDKQAAIKLQEAYSSSNPELRKKFEKYKLG